MLIARHRTLRVFLSDQGLSRTIMDGTPIERRTLRQERDHRTCLLQILANVDNRGYEGRSVHQVPISAIRVAYSQVVERSSRTFVVSGTRVQVFRTKVLTFSALNGSLTIYRRLIGNFQEVIVRDVTATSRYTSRHSYHRNGISPRGLQRAFVRGLCFHVAHVITGDHRISLRSDSQFRIHPCVRVFHANRSYNVRISLNVHGRPTFFVYLICVTAARIARHGASPQKGSR